MSATAVSLRAGTVAVLGLDPGGMEVARRIADVIGERGVMLDAREPDAEAWLTQYVSLVGLAVIAGTDLPRTVAATEGETEAAAIRSLCEEAGVAHLAVECGQRLVWVGPSVIPGQPGCHACWQARRRQHAGAHAAQLAITVDDESGQPGPARQPGEPSLRLAARAAMAVTRRALRTPQSEAGVVRYFRLDDTDPAGGRVIAVSGCPRCDPVVERSPGWSLSSL